MKFATAFRLAWNILKHAKLRSWLTIIGIIVGVAAVVLIISIGDGAKLSLRENLDTFGTNVITVSPGFDRAIGPSSGFAASYFARDSARVDAKNLSNRELQVLYTVPGIAAAMGLVSDRAEVEFQGETALTSIQGVDPLKWREFSNVELKAGRFLQVSDSRSVVIGQRVAEEVFKNNVSVNSQLKISGYAMRVVGVLDKSSGFSNQQDNSIYTTTETARQIAGKADSNDFSSISILPRDAVDIPALLKQIETRLMAVRGENDRTRTFSLISLESAQQRISQTIDAMTLFLAAIAIISLIVGAIGIANTMFTAVLEKTKDIGIMKAVGATDNDVMLVFLINAGLIGVVGGLIGVSIGVLGAFGFSSLNIPFGPPNSTNTLKAIVTPFLIVSMLAFSIFIGVVSGLVPAYRAARLKPAQALKYE